MKSDLTSMNEQMVNNSKSRDFYPFSDYKHTVFASDCTI